MRNTMMRGQGQNQVLLVSDEDVHACCRDNNHYHDVCQILDRTVIVEGRVLLRQAL